MCAVNTYRYGENMTDLADKECSLEKTVEHLAVTKAIIRNWIKKQIYLHMELAEIDEWVKSVF